EHSLQPARAIHATRIDADRLADPRHGLAFVYVSVQPHDRFIAEDRVPNGHAPHRDLDGRPFDHDGAEVLVQLDDCVEPTVERGAMEVQHHWSPVHPLEDALDPSAQVALVAFTL